ncbi:MAG TPA: hypothetical protein VNM90_09960 [Haliangium sp.]|nr:hypothetical protein [Haliangium sp.]
MRFRVGIVDLCVAIVVLAVILLPERSVTVGHAYEPKPGRLREIALEQARLAVAPDNSEAADRLARLLTDVGQTDWAIQVAGSAAKHSDRVSWRALLAVSTAHAERIEVVDAHRYAKLALDACLAAGPEQCPVDERVRISLYFDQLDAGVKSGIDPRIDPAGYQRAVLAAMRIIRYRGSMPPEAPTSPEKDEPSPDQGGTQR